MQSFEELNKNWFIMLPQDSGAWKGYSEEIKLQVH